MKFFKKIAILCLAFFVSSEVLADSFVRPMLVRASWYGEWHQGRLMANGKPFNMYDPTIVAHPTLPLGTRLLVRNVLNGRERVVMVQDRGPYVRGRSLDASFALARYLGFAKEGHTVLEVILL